MTPLVYTKYGNLPIEELRYEERWTDNADMTMLERIYWKDDELVSNSVHIFGRKKLDMIAEQAKI